MSTQADLAAREATLATIVQSQTDALASQKTLLDTLAADVLALKNANPSLDLTSLDASITALQANTGAIAAATAEIQAADPGPQPA